MRMVKNGILFEFLSVRTPQSQTKHPVEFFQVAAGRKYGPWSGGVGREGGEKTERGWARGWMAKVVAEAGGERSEEKPWGGSEGAWE